MTVDFLYLFAVVGFIVAVAGLLTVGAVADYLSRRYGVLPAVAAAVGVPPVILYIVISIAAAVAR